MSTIKRREFLKTSTNVIVGGIITSYGLQSFKVLPSQKVNVGMIGVGIHGFSYNLKAFLALEDVNVIAVCDVDSDHLNRAKSRIDETYGNKACKTYSDFRNMLLDPDIDAVMISTPDHWHVPISILAAQAGKDIICEKPTLTVQEGRILCDVIKKTGVIYQTSIEDRCLPNYVKLVEIVKNGRIGELKNIYIDLPEKVFGPDDKIDVTVMEPPRTLDYDMWLGPAPYKPYSPARVHRNFRFCSDYSGGYLTDWGAHHFDTANRLNNSDHIGPIEVEGTGKFFEHPIYDVAYKFDVKYKYPNGVNMFVRSGGNSIKCEGTEGWVAINKWNAPLTASSESIIKTEFEKNDIRVATAPSEHRNFIDCVKSRKETLIPAEVGHRISSALHLGNISMKLGRKLNWDYHKEKFIGDDEANNMLSRVNRDPWKLENLIK